MFSQSPSPVSVTMPMFQLAVVCSQPGRTAESLQLVKYLELPRFFSLYPHVVTVSPNTHFFFFFFAGRMRVPKRLSSTETGKLNPYAVTALLHEAGSSGPDPDVALEAISKHMWRLDGALLSSNAHEKFSVGKATWNPSLSFQCVFLLRVWSVFTVGELNE